jgi:peroxiredoxin
MGCRAVLGASLASQAQAEQAPAEQASIEVGIQEGQRAPDFELKDLEGRTIKLSDYRGQVVLVNFWATWCAHCRTEFPIIQDAYESNQEEGFVVLAVNVQDRRESVLAYTQELGLTFPALLDPLGRATGSYKARVLPTSYFVDQEGIIVLKKVGAIDRSIIDGVLAQTGVN